MSQDEFYFNEHSRQTAVGAPTRTSTSMKQMPRHVVKLLPKVNRKGMTCVPIN